MNMVIENVRQLRHDADDSCPIGPDGKRQHTYDYREGGCRQVQEHRSDRQSGLGQSDDRLGHGHAARLRGGTIMAVQATYLGMPLSIDDLDGENLAYFRHCAEHDFHLQQCDDCKLLRYPPTTACPWCTCPKSDWAPVEGKGAVHSYDEVHHGIQPAFQARTPYLVLLVDLDTQKGKPTEHEALRVDRQPDHAGRQAGAARHGEAGRHRHAHAHGVHRCGARASRCRNGRSTRPRRSRPSRGAIRRNDRGQP